MEILSIVVGEEGVRYDRSGGLGTAVAIRALEGVLQALRGVWLEEELARRMEMKEGAKGSETPVVDG